VSHNQLVDLGPLGALNLHTLLAEDNDVTDLTPLDEQNLTELRLSSNAVSDIAALAGMTNLQILHVDLNQVTNVAALGQLLELSDLDLHDNLLIDLQPIVDNAGIGAGDLVDVSQNPFEESCAASATQLEALRERGVELTTLCP
jgi:Leucine-rich repeat (LRR) protein